MRSSSSELLLDQQQELRKRKLLELTTPKVKAKPLKRTCKQRVSFYTTSVLAMFAVSAGSSLLFLVPLYVDPAISTLVADFISDPVTCVTTRRDDLTGLFNCTWSSCREGCTSDMYRCTHIYVSYAVPIIDNTTMTNTTSNSTSRPLPPSPLSNSSNIIVFEDAVLLVNIKGCGYPPDVQCENFTDLFGVEGAEYPCFYSRENRTVVMAHYDREEQVAVIVNFFAIPFVITLATSVALCVMHCDCRCSSGKTRQRHPRRPRIENLSDYDACVETSNVAFGTGIISMPYAFTLGGLYFGICGTLIIGMLITYNVKVLVDCSYTLCVRNRVPDMGYSDVTRAAFADGPSCFQNCSRCSKWFIDALIVINQVGSCAIYVIFLGSSLEYAVSQWVDKEDQLSLRVYMCFALIVLLPLTFLRSMKHIAPFSFYSDLFMMVGIVLCMYYILANQPDISERRGIGYLVHIPTFFGAVLYSLNVITVIMPIENQMRHPRHLTKLPCGVLIVGMIFITAFYILVGFFGYWKYGEETNKVILRNLPLKDGIALTAMGFVMLGVIFTYSIQHYAMSILCWKYLEEIETMRVFLEYLIRLILYIFVAAVAMAIPDTAYILAIIGVACAAPLGLCFPPVIQMFTYWRDEDDCTLKFSWLIIKNIIFILLGLTGMVSAISIFVLEQWGSLY